jgi:insulysin
LLQPSFYHQMRTEKQLGYAVAAMAAPLFNLENSLLIVQSPGTTEENIIKEIDSFLDTQQSQLKNDFEINQQSLIKKLREPARSLKELGDRYWSAITNYDELFSRRLDLADAVARITPESLSKYYRNVFMDKNRRLWLASDALAEREKFLLIDDLAVHKKQMQSIVQP